MLTRGEKARAPDTSARSERRLAALVIALAVPVHLAGLVAPSLYRDPAILIPQNLGTDLVTLCVTIPLLAISTFAYSGSLRARVISLGSLGYLVYAYGMYALGVHWNRLFLAYVALFGLSSYALVLGLIRTDAGRVRAAFSSRVPIRPVSGYLIAVALLVGAVWLVDEILATATGVAPRSIGEFDAPTNIVHVFDLALVLPALLVAGLLLLRHQAWGYVLAGMLMMKSTAIGLWVLAMIGFSARQGYPAPLEYTLMFVAVTLVGAVLTWRYLAALEPGPREERAAVAAGAAR